MSDGIKSPVASPIGEMPPVSPPVAVAETEISSVEADAKALQEMTSVEAEPSSEAFLEEVIEAQEIPAPGEPVGAAVETQVAPSQTEVMEDPLHDQVVKILVEDLGQLGEEYKELAENGSQGKKQQLERFVEASRQLAARLVREIRAGKLQERGAHEEIHKWLSTIPGVNKYFLMQMAKIKTDKLLQLEQTEHETPS
ncbi:MAG: hypothetical protein WCV84_06045 [Patescibacteria group bacterium]